MCFQEAPVYVEPSFIKLHLYWDFEGNLFSESFFFSSAGRLHKPFLGRLPLGCLPTDTSARTQHVLHCSGPSYDSWHWADWRCSVRLFLAELSILGASSVASRFLFSLKCCQVLDLWAFSTNFWSLDSIGYAQREADDDFEASHLFFPLLMGQYY